MKTKIEEGETELVAVDEETATPKISLAQFWEAQLKNTKMDKTSVYEFKLGDGSVFAGTPYEFLYEITKGRWSYKAVHLCRIPTALPEGTEPPLESVAFYADYLKKCGFSATRMEILFEDGTGFVGEVARQHATARRLMH